MCEDGVGVESRGLYYYDRPGTACNTIRGPGNRPGNPYRWEWILKLEKGGAQERQIRMQWPSVYDTIWRNRGYL